MANQTSEQKLSKSPSSGEPRSESPNLPSDVFVSKYVSAGRHRKSSYMPTKLVEQLLDDLDSLDLAEWAKQGLSPEVVKMRGNELIKQAKIEGRYKEFVSSKFADYVDLSYAPLLDKKE